MHLHDRQQLEFEEGLARAVAPGRPYGGLTEIAELELASELLEVESEHDLGIFIGHVAASYPPSPAVPGVLTVARRVAPRGALVMGAQPTSSGGATNAARSARQLREAKLLSLELEGMSPEDREFELARRWVRFITRALECASRQPRNRRSPAALAQSALTTAARDAAPSLVGHPVLKVAPSTGSWARRGRSIVVYLD